MTTLRDQAIKLAHDNPGEVRDALLPILAKTARGIGIGKTIQTPALRFHRYSNSLQVTSMIGAGKRGKRLPRFSVWDNTARGQDEIEPYFARILKARSYDDALRIGREAVEMVPEWKIEETVLRGVDVIPVDQPPIEFSGRHVRVKITPHDFWIRDLDDEYNEPTIIASGTSRRSTSGRWQTRTPFRT